MSSPITQIKEIWNKLPLGGRIAVVAAVVVTAGLLGAVVYYGSQPEYAVLFSDLKPTDAQAIVEKLKAQNVPYGLTNNGTSVSVPSEKVSELRLQMASSGVLSGGHVGFDLFDKTSFGATDFAQQVNYRRAIEGELAKTLEGMDEIEQARVHITPKKDSIFTEKEEGAKASVTVRVRQGRELANEKTEAIVSLLASAVEGLDPSNVSVMDTRGRLLTEAGRERAGGAGDAGAFNAQLASKQKFEAETASRVIALLEPVVGAGKVRADVSADVDFSKVEQTEEKFNPNSQVVRSQQSTQEVRAAKTGGASVGGVAGARSNDPTAQAKPPAPQPAPSGNDQRVATTTNYEIDRTVRKTIGGGGRVNRLSVSVVLDHKNVSGVQTARTPEEIKQVQELVGAAVGADTARGDSVVVQTMLFDQPKDEAATPTAADRVKEFAPMLIKYGALVLVALMLFLFVIRPARKALKAAAAPAVVAEETKLLAAAENVEERRELAEANAATIASTPEIVSNDETEILKQLPTMKTVAEIEAELQAELERDAANEPMERLRAATVKKLLAEQTAREPELVATAMRGWLKNEG